MKSKKIIALIVAFAAFMAVATSGLAATVTYNYKNDGYVDVEVDVYAQAGKEVTYLVKNGNDIVYIDQQTADSVTGLAEFNYKILDSKVSYTSTIAKFGTNGEDFAVDGADTTLPFDGVTVTAPNATVSYWKNQNCTEGYIGTEATIGTNDTVYVKVAANDNYRIASYTVGDDTEVVSQASVTIPVVYGQDITVATEPVVQDPAYDELNVEIAVSADEYADKDLDGNGIAGDETNIKTHTTVFKVVGNPVEIGVTYNGKNYPAQTLSGEAFTDGYCAVRLVTIDGTEITDVQPYMIEE